MIRRIYKVSLRNAHFIFSPDPPVLPAICQAGPSMTLSGRCRLRLQQTVLSFHLMSLRCCLLQFSGPAGH